MNGREVPPTFPARKDSADLDELPSPLISFESTPSWRVHYAWSRHRGGPGLSVRLFRRKFQWPQEIDQVRIHITADARYRLWLNGRAVGFGPAKGSLGRYHFDTYDLTGWVQTGVNVLAAEVRWFGENSPGSEVHSPLPGFLLQCDDLPELDTPGAWKVFVSDAVTPDTTSYIENAQQFLDHTEHLDLRRVPKDWRSAKFDEAGWDDAISTGSAAAHGQVWGVAPMRSLVPRDVPAMGESRHRFARTIRNRVELEHPFGGDPRGWKVGAGQGVTLLLDAGMYATAYPEIRFSGGAHREVRVMYAEALGQWERQGGCDIWQKRGVRDDFTRLDPHGYRDTVILRGGLDCWEPFFWRAFRWIQLEVLPGDQPMTVEDATFRLCVHPQRFSARFVSSDQQAEKLFNISIQTLRVGAHEIYDDSPYFEQFSYIADSRLEALGSLHLCNDTSLPRRTIQLFLDTVRADGLVDARVPCQYARQTIPYFCLHWIFMVEDYWRWVGVADVSFVRRCLVAVDSILVYFRARIRPDCFLGPTGGWNMVDMAEEWPNGEPPAVTLGGSTYLTCLYIDALTSATRLHRAAGVAEDSTRWHRLAGLLRRSVRARAWDDEQGLFVEGADHRTARFSQHTQAAAILADVADAAKIRRIASRLCADPKLIRTNSMQSFYLTRALEKAGRFADWHAQVLQPWRNAMNNGVTTWPEYPDPCRSESHAWAAWPAVDYVASILGIRPGAAGWTVARLMPQTSGLDWAKGSAPTPRGEIKVEWKKSCGTLRFRAETPSGLNTEVVLPGRRVRSFPDGGPIDLTVAG